MTFYFMFFNKEVFIKSFYIPVENSHHRFIQHSVVMSNVYALHAQSESIETCELSSNRNS